MAVAPECDTALSGSATTFDVGPNLAGGPDILLQNFRMSDPTELLNLDGPSFHWSPEPSIAVTIERDRQPLYNLEVRFQLTEREREAVGHLTERLTSKEIARRMNISPHTVKTFLRLVMIKMGVTTRSGVIGKIIDAAH